MHPIIKNALAVITGLVIGSVVNMSIVMISGSIVPPPEGAEITTMEGLQASIHLFEPKHFLLPFLAHALGTLIGSLVAAKIAASKKLIISLIIGSFFLIGGVVNVQMLGGPAWFNATDIILAYIPMAWFGWKIADKK